MKKRKKKIYLKNKIFSFLSFKNIIIKKIDEYFIQILSISIYAIKSPIIAFDIKNHLQMKLSYLK